MIAVSDKLVYHLLCFVRSIADVCVKSATGQNNCPGVLSNKCGTNLRGRGIFFIPNVTKCRTGASQSQLGWLQEIRLKCAKTLSVYVRNDLFSLLRNQNKANYVLHCFGPKALNLSYTRLVCL